MRFPDKKRLVIFAIGALIITIIVNFPHLINSLSEPQFPQVLPSSPLLQDFGFLPFRRPNPAPRLTSGEFMIFQFLWYFIFSFGLLFVFGTYRDAKGQKGKQEIWVLVSKVVILVTFFYVAENILIRQLVDHFDFRFKHRFDAIVFSRYLFIVVISSLTGYLIRMMDRQNSIQVENEKLRSENLQIQYNALTNQMNPHFFFNSLNSLQYLLIEGEQQKSVIYINELSTVFRYILQSSKKELVLLRNELDFLRSYQYLLEIRFEDKIRFELDIPEAELDKEIPVLTLQPLVENAINHNGCSSSAPLIISIYLENDNLIVHNNRIPKIRKSSGEGIGLSNLKKRFLLLLEKEIRVVSNEHEFKIVLPLK